MTGISKDPKRVLGVRAHSGWAAYVVLCGPADAPRILGRGRMRLCDPAIEGSKQPFHEAEPMTFARAESFVAGCRASTHRLAMDALEELSPLSRCCLLTAAGRALPDLKAILASHTLIHTAEGAFYRDAVAEACAAKDIEVLRIRERDLESEAEHLKDWRRRIADFGKEVGSPWTQDEKLSALGAWLALAAKRPNG